MVVLAGLNPRQTDAAISSYRYRKCQKTTAQCFNNTTALKTTQAHALINTVLPIVPARHFITVLAPYKYIAIF